MAAWCALALSEASRRKITFSNPVTRSATYTSRSAIARPSLCRHRDTLPVWGIDVECDSLLPMVFSDEQVTGQRDHYVIFDGVGNAAASEQADALAVLLYQPVGHLVITHKAMAMGTLLVLEI